MTFSNHQRYMEKIIESLILSQKFALYVYKNRAKIYKNIFEKFHFFVKQIKKIGAHLTKLFAP